MYSLIFHGRRLAELQKRRNSSILLNLTQIASVSSNSFSSATRVGRKGKTFTVSYLVGSLGLSTKLAESISRYVSFDEKGNPDSVLNLFRSFGFTDSQISSIIRDFPRLLTADAERSIGPKLKLLQSMKGASSSELAEIVTKVPKMLGMKDDKTISVYYDFVKEVIEADKSSKFETLCHSSLPQGSKQENKFRNILVLRELGMPQRLLFSLLTSESQPICGKEKFEESLKKVVEMGFDPTTSKFVQALRVLYQRSDKTTEEKVNIYKRLGLAVGEDDVWEMFKKWPQSLTYSEKKITQTFESLKKCGLVEDEVRSVLKKFPQCMGVSEQNISNSTETFLGLGFTKDEFVRMVKCCPPCLNLSAVTVKKKTEFLVKKMNWPRQALVSYPQVLGLSMEKRIVPRCNVIKALLSKESKLPSMEYVLKSTDEVFLQRFVRKHEDKQLVAELMAKFTGDRAS